MPFKEDGSLVDYIEINGKKVPSLRCETEVTLTNIVTRKEYMSDKEAEEDIQNPDTNTKKEHIRRDVKVTVPKVVIGSGTLKT
tara:strand:+ start:88 stop:336 length:249 start_codon:yes stop_codon:yes gene_type:complete